MQRQARHDTGSHWQEHKVTKEILWENLSTLFDIWQCSLCTAWSGSSGDWNAERQQRSASLEHLCVFQIPNYWVILIQSIQLRACEELPNPKNTEQHRISFGHVFSVGNHSTSTSWICIFKHKDLYIHVQWEGGSFLCIDLVLYVFQYKCTNHTNKYQQVCDITIMWEQHTQTRCRHSTQSVSGAYILYELRQDRSPFA